MKSESDAHRAVSLFEEKTSVKTTLAKLASELAKNVRFNCVASFPDRVVCIDLSEIMPSEENALITMFKSCLERKLEKIVRQLQQLGYEA